MSLWGDLQMPKTPSQNSGEHLREDTVYLAEFIGGIIDKLVALYFGKMGYLSQMCCRETPTCEKEKQKPLSSY